jgi:peroxiredoxin
MKRLFPLLIVAILAAVMAWYPAGGASEKAATTAGLSDLVGQQAHDFTLPNVHNYDRKLSDFRGKYVILEWVDFECPYVRKHYDSKNLQTMQTSFREKDVIWLSVCSISPGQEGYLTGDNLLARIREERSNASDFLVDSDGRVARLYGLRVTPTLFLIDPDGVIFYAGAVDDDSSSDPAHIGKAINHIRLALEAVLSTHKIPPEAPSEYGCDISR